ncbi:P-loop containing nucleoside triphosphate hydrolase protein [Hygrophoropsis aurantiaca]|uniref:P-loop containing nucleoside triphosphate hydrolase protein n=1 Tax=Hygrophoropsis aurantiaca TaxID=72124 RepID=A0ACB7ZWK7_9AGAM|nr:P-loop containing nucleoside triphosphate hydrolase protein [Hygrophoropsis aurantiaca]
MNIPRTPPAPETPRGCRHKHYQTPRTRKAPSSNPLPGINTSKETVQDVKEKVSKRLKLQFEMDDWQAHMIHRVRQGYDSILVAGTGYGKSLVFQGLAAMEKKKLVIVICPLKALERDQVSEAEAKGLRASMINENTVSPSVWASLRQGKDHLYYVSPEMALGDSFAALWQDANFRARVQAVIVDEAHCIVEWGDDFRKEYGDLSKLRNYIGQEVPVVACTATCSTHTFNVIWKSLSFIIIFWFPTILGHQRGIIFPPIIPNNAPPTIIPKCLFYFEKLSECRAAVETIRKILPEHLRGLVQTFVALASENAKALVWDKFREGKIRILCATDAAGMGCNVPDVQYVVLLTVPRSISVLAQRWGRGGRDRALEAVCMLFLPKWAFRPKACVPGVTKKGKIKLMEPKSHTSNRNKIEQALEALINLGYDETNPGCIHKFMKTHFRPNTKLNVYKNLNQQLSQPVKLGIRSQQSAVQLSWTVLDLGRSAPPGRCCHNCNPSLLERYLPPTPHDARLTAYATEFLFPLQVRVPETDVPTTQRPHALSVSSITSQESSLSTTSAGVAIAMPMSQAPFVPIKHKFTLAAPQQEKLEAILDSWRTQRHAQRTQSTGGWSLMSKRADLPDKTLKQMVQRSSIFLQVADITPELIRQVVQWDLASTADLSVVSALITEWRLEAAESITPSSRAGKRKKARQMVLGNDEDPDATPHASPQHALLPLSQPAFSPVRITSTSMGIKDRSQQIPSGSAHQVSSGNKQGEPFQII